VGACNRPRRWRRDWPLEVRSQPEGGGVMLGIADILKMGAAAVAGAIIAGYIAHCLQSCRSGRSGRNRRPFALSTSP